MRALTKSRWTKCVAVALLTACEAGPTAPSGVSDPAGGQPGFLLQDGTNNNGNPHFFWLPPIVSSPAYLGVFDGGLSPVVQICEWNGASCSALLAEYTMLTGPGSETIRVVPQDQLYVVNWHTDQFVLDPAKTYRIVVVVDGQELGVADIDPVQNGSQLKHVQTNEYIALVNGRTLPIKFRIEEGALGSDITIDATALTSPSIDVRGPAGPIGFFPTSQPLTLPGDAGAYSIADRFGGTPIPFTITSVGLIDYDVHYDAIFAGRGTSTLTVLGHQYTVDGTQLSTAFIVFGGIGGLANSAPLVRVELPGAKDVQDASGGVLFYDVTTAGTIAYSATDEAIADGAGTTTLTLVGYDYTVDARLLSTPNFVLGAIGAFPTTTPHVVTGLPGPKNVVDVSGGAVDYQLTAGGLIAYSAQDEIVLDGQGTTTLTVVGHEITVDATLMSGGGFSIGGVGSFATASPAVLVLLAGQKAFISVDLSFAFSIDDAGTVDYDPALDARVSGRGTATLTILF